MKLNTTRAQRDAAFLSPSIWARDAWQFAADCNALEDELARVLAVVREYVEAKNEAMRDPHMSTIHYCDLAWHALRALLPESKP